MKTTYYRIGQALPPRHWYQRRVGWFGKLLTGILVISLAGVGAVGYTLNKNAIRSYAAQTSGTERLRKVTSALDETSLENIIDVQFVLDKWAQQHKDQKWSVVAKSITGPNIDAQLHGDSQYESVSLQKLLVTLPLFEQIPADQQKNLKIDAGTDRFTMQTCVDLMIRLSNEVCAQAVNRYLDFGKASDQFKKAGLMKTSLKGNSVKTSAADTARYLALLQSESTTRTTKDTIMKLLYEQPYRSGIAAACPGCLVAGKSSSTDRLVHDASFLSYKGGSYVLVIMTDKGTIDQVAELAAKIQQKIVDTTQN